MPCFLFPKMFCEKVENKRRFSTSFCLYAFVSLLCVDLFGLAHLTFTIHKDANQPLLGTREVRSLFHTDTLTHTKQISIYTDILWGSRFFLRTKTLSHEFAHEFYCFLNIYTIQLFCEFAIGRERALNLNVYYKYFVFNTQRTLVFPHSHALGSEFIFESWIFFSSARKNPVNWHQTGLKRYIRILSFTGTHSVHISSPWWNISIKIHWQRNANERVNEAIYENTFKTHAGGGKRDEDFLCCFSLVACLFACSFACLHSLSFVPVPVPNSSSSSNVQNLTKWK